MTSELANIPTYLQLAINAEEKGVLSYSKSGKDTVCDVLQSLVIEKGSIEVDPKMLAYYLLIEHPEYSSGDLSDILRLFINYCKEVKSEITLRLVLNIYDLIDREYSMDREYFTDDMEKEILHAKLWMAASIGDVDVVMELVKHDINLDDGKFVDTTPLAQALQNGHMNIVKNLVKGSNFILPSEEFIKNISQDICFATLQEFNTLLGFVSSLDID